MSNTARPNTIDDLAIASARIVPLVPAMLAGLILAVLLISFDPFPAAVASGEAPGASKINQLGFGGLAVLSLAAMATLGEPRRLLGLISVPWLALFGFLFLSAVIAPNTMAALRTTGFIIAALVAVWAVLVLPRNAEQLAATLLIGCGAMLALSYVGLVVFPDAAKHGYDALEPQHAGFWRGVYTHKNMAGPVMTSVVFVGLYVFRARGWWLGLLLAAAAAVFVLQSGSKTSMGTMAIAIIAVLGPSAMGLRFVGAVLAVTLIGLFGLFTVGSVLFEPVGNLVEALAPGNTYTGRTDLWRFALEMIAERPWTGYGFDTLFGKPAVMEMERPYDAGWDFRGIVNAHSAYLDLALDMGLIALALMVWLSIFKPVLDYLRVQRFREEVLLADMFLMIVIFIGMNGFMETFFLRRANPVWLLLAFALFGLHLAARGHFRFASRP